VRIGFLQSCSAIVSFRSIVLPSEMSRQVVLTTITSTGANVTGGSGKDAGGCLAAVVANVHFDSDPDRPDDVTS
jgi:hypothetical protein